MSLWSAQCPGRQQLKQVGIIETFGSGGWRPLPRGREQVLWRLLRRGFTQEQTSTELHQVHWGTSPMNKAEQVQIQYVPVSIQGSKGKIYDSNVNPSQNSTQHVYMCVSLFRLCTVLFCFERYMTTINLKIKSFMTF